MICFKFTKTNVSPHATRVIKLQRSTPAECGLNPIQSGTSHISEHDGSVQSKLDGVQQFWK